MKPKKQSKLKTIAAAKTWVTILMLSVCQLELTGQLHDTLNLEICLKLASERSLIVQQKGISGRVKDIKLKNLNVNWLPAVGINAQANYNSETIDFSDLLEGIPVALPDIPQDQYKIWADINQPLYDGGAIKAQKNMERSAYEVEIQQAEVDLYSVRQKVLQVYFSILIADKSREVFEVSLEELKERKEVLQAGLDNGVVLPEDVMGMEAEQLRIEQMIAEIGLSRQTLVYNLSVLIDSILPADIQICTPAEPENLTGSSTRPEFLWFERKKASFDASKKIITASDMPRIFAFSQVAYGRPGFNIISDEFHDYYTVGLGMTWNFLSYGEKKRQKQILDLQKELIDIQRESFDDQMNMQLETEKNNIQKYAEFLDKDEVILQLRKDIKETSFSRLSHGVISSTDYLSDYNKEILARLQLENHKLLKVQATYNYIFIQGKL